MWLLQPLGSSPSGLYWVVVLTGYRFWKPSLALWDSVRVTCLWLPWGLRGGCPLVHLWCLWNLFGSSLEPRPILPRIILCLFLLTCRCRWTFQTDILKPWIVVWCPLQTFVGVWGCHWWWCHLHVWVQTLSVHLVCETTYMSGLLISSVNSSSFQSLMPP